MNPASNAVRKRKNRNRGGKSKRLRQGREEKRSSVVEVEKDQELETSDKTGKIVQLLIATQRSSDIRKRPASILMGEGKGHERGNEGRRMQCRLSRGGRGRTRSGRALRSPALFRFLTSLMRTKRGQEREAYPTKERKEDRNGSGYAKKGFAAQRKERNGSRRNVGKKKINGGGDGGTEEGKGEVEFVRLKGAGNDSRNPRKLVVRVKGERATSEGGEHMLTRGVEN